MKKPEKNQNPPPAPEAPAAPDIHYSLDEIQESIAAPFEVRFTMGQSAKEFAIKARHLTPEECEHLKLLLDEVMPGVIKGKTEADDRMDYTNPDFLARQTRVTRVCRSLALFWACEAFRAKLAATNPDAAANPYSPAHRPAIVEFMRKLLVDDLQEYIYTRIRSAPINISSTVNFT